MIRYAVLGFVDAGALRDHKLVLRTLLDLDAIQETIDQNADNTQSGEISVDGHPFIRHNGFLTFPMPVIKPRAVNFVVRIAQQTGCDIADVEIGDIMTVDAFRAHSARMAELLLQTPDPFQA